MGSRAPAGKVTTLGEVPRGGHRYLAGLVSRVVESAPVGAVLRLLEWAGPHSAGSFQVLTYHRIDEPGSRPMLDPDLAVSPARFEQQVKFLANRYRVVSTDQVLRALAGEEELPRGAVLITFDDGYLDFAEHAWPILKCFGLPVTLFVPTAFPGRPEKTFWWDRLYHAMVSSSRKNLVDTPWGTVPLGSAEDRLKSFRKLREQIKTLPQDQADSCIDDLYTRLSAPNFDNPVLNWDQLRSLAREGVSIAPHSQTHPLLNRLPLAKAAVEISSSQKDLIRELGAAPPIFAYPGGSYSPSLMNVLKNQGFRLAFTTRAGTNRVGQDDPLALKRFHVGVRTSLPILRAKLLNWTPS